MSNSEEVILTGENNFEDFLLECVRQGRADLIQSYCSDEKKREMCDQIFMQDRSSALRRCMILWVDAVKIAKKAGMPDSVVDDLFERCINKSQNASTPWLLIKVSGDYLIELAKVIDDNVWEYEYSPIFVRFHKYVKDHIGESLCIDDMAKALNMSKSHLSHTIKKETGETVHNWVMKEKVNAAKIMLTNKTYSMSQVWHFLGFCSQSHFAKCFRQVTGMTPTQFKVRD